MKFLKQCFFLLLVANLAHCGAAGTRVGNPPTASLPVFPSALAVTSPLASSSSTSSSLSSLAQTKTGTPLYSTSFDDAISEINAILNGDSASDCEFDPGEILSQSTDAACYGPEVAYTNHPDSNGFGPEVNPLPPGDLGFWQEDEGTSGESCAAAQLNAQMTGLTDQTLVALKAMASLICLANANSLDLPDTDAETLDLTSQATDLISASSASVTSASITLNSLTSSTDNLSVDISLSDTTDSYTYALSFNFTDTNMIDHDVTLSLKHVPLNTDNTTYVGELSYSYDFDDNIQQNCPSSDLLRAGAITYYKPSTTELNIQADAASYCGADAEPFTTAGILDPDDGYDATTNTDGWANNWSSFFASFDPDTQAGDYSYAWQAGQNDSHTRVMNLNLTQDETTSLLDGSAFFAFGPNIATENEGIITGMICNWTGPNSFPRTVSTLVQRQDIEENSSGLFTASESQITYAPTNSCDYDGTGSFEYDSNGDGTIDTDPTVAILNDLFDLDADADNVADDANGNGVADEIEDSGFMQPLVRSEYGS